MAAAGAPMPNRVYVYNLAYSVTAEQLGAHMGSAGAVTGSEIILTRSGMSKGCALVTFETAEQAANAIATLNGSMLNDREIYLREDRDQSKPAEGVRAPRGAARGAARGGARPFAPREGAPAPAAGGAGGFRGGRGGARGGYAARPAAAAEGGEAKPRQPIVPGSSLYVGNLSWAVSWQDLKDAFGAFHPIYSDVKKTFDGKSKGWGIVRFSTAEDAAAAMAALNETDLKGRNMSVRLDNGPKPRAEGTA